MTCQLFPEPGATLEQINLTAHPQRPAEILKKKGGTPGTAFFDRNSRDA
ncbi:MAG: hypothetical protein K1566_12810 [Candidatus Thiodiazotropha sp. (ex. Lucinisca nassula)]|nr:hypothetical protein [Candidatus Thiodiazotropha sp. (ex. Lucinisca nassula)]MBW9263568.1 hypothetical protein [Candidatus Thiodiazotropha sp. (ex. Lucinisca nassula)]MBW9270516.1 hypothetical protein [Candidatus Thiodiazotropha sp. (ex. Lucinisca nassula)]